jgi:hypothetical protein
MKVLHNDSAYHFVNSKSKEHVGSGEKVHCVSRGSDSFEIILGGLLSYPIAKWRAGHNLMVIRFVRIEQDTVAVNVSFGVGSS